MTDDKPANYGRYLTHVPLGQPVWVGGIKIIAHRSHHDGRVLLCIEAPREIKIRKERIES